MWLRNVAQSAWRGNFTIYQSSQIGALGRECCILGNFKSHHMLARWKYMQHKGVKGIRNKKSTFETLSKEESESDINMSKCEDINNEPLNLDDRAYEELANSAMHISPGSLTQNVFIIQPYVKWGSERNTLTTPEDQLEEAKALVDSLPNWRVAHAIKVPLETLHRKALFGSGKIEELKKQLQEHNTKKALSCLFISKSTLSFGQKRFLEEIFKLPVLDRYSVVIQILRLHATSAEARLQVAMAEIPYIWTQAKDANPSLARKQGYSFTDTQREILRTRERRLKQELERIRGHRKLLRNKRKQKNYPVIAVVGYTNAGKTSLIKALTHEQSLQPRNQLFATLDVTAHAGILPCNLEVIYMDTVGFMSDLPTGLMECFVATLEDAMLADIILHVQDLSHKCKQAQQQHVIATLASLQNSIASNDQMPPIINVGNKIDLVSPAQVQPSEDTHLVSATKATGLKELLLEIEHKVLTVTGRRKMTMRVRNGGAEVAWLYKNAAVTDVRADEGSAEHLLMTVVISELTMQRFIRTFLSSNHE
ncbi:putative GTP-binding protein 6 isoform X1 [Rhagoletis pomonella]|uniref:putative GTP-binding protein 6 isoform X1 n=1 Tax=Rhagoletis pomonella TaxID=28610 RepID=UPI00177AC913|nr:putative GTP-binding protein 6 isoform X1 [Rhagoletis pomonella]XP_036323179.1 putative GTP-binding protein 6 isoform X2 [Rhagoletis pomonella]XP_036323187.1 putative GTP-binding protein 6 isoform X1 [Rhagoletis pomonella]